MRTEVGSSARPRKVEAARCAGPRSSTNPRTRAERPERDEDKSVPAFHPPPAGRGRSQAESDREQLTERSQALGRFIRSSPAILETCRASRGGAAVGSGRSDPMKRLSAFIATTGLGLALLLTGAGDAWAQWRHGWYGGGWRGPGWHSPGFGIGFGWGRPGWGWNRGWGWNAGWGWQRPGWGWNRGWWPGYAGLGLGWGATSPYYNWGASWPYSTYDWPYGRYYGSWGSPAYLGAYAAPRTTIVTGRSVATGSIGTHCATPARTCLLKQASYVGIGCSCKVTGGRARGSVTP
jgi:hypothetical protein